MNEDQQLEEVRGQYYRIVVAGELDPSWSAWLDELEITSCQAQGGGVLTILSGRLSDQAALRGILNKIWDLRLTLVSINRD